MPWNPGIQPIGGQLIAQGITSGANALSTDLIKAMQRYEEDKKQHDFNTGMFESIKDDPNMSKYVPQDALARWYSMNPDKQAGVLAGVARRSADDLKQQALDRQQEMADSQQNLIEAQAHNEWGGNPNGPDATLNLSPEEIAAGAGVGKVPLRTSGRSFQWAEDPNNPANMGMAEPMPIDKFGRKVDPANPGAEVVGIQGNNGTIHLFPKPTDIETYMKERAKSQPRPTVTPTPTPGATAAPSATPSVTPSPTVTPAATDKVRVRAPNGVVGSIPKSQLQDAVAQGYTIIQ